MKNVSHLTWQSKVPTRPGLYIRTYGQGSATLMLVSVERFLDGSRHAYLTDVTADFVPGPLGKPVREVLHHLPASRDKTQARFLGPIKLPRVPTARVLARACRELPTEPGIYFLSRNLGHAWLHQLVSVSVHRYQVGDGQQRDELFAVDLPSLEARSFKDDTGAVLTLALPQYRKLNLQQLPK